MTLSEVARNAGISPGSARRVLRTLQQLDYLHSDGQRFSLAPRTLQLGYAYLSSQPLASLVQPRLTQLVEKLEGSCSVSVLDGHRRGLHRSRHRQGAHARLHVGRNALSRPRHVARQGAARRPASG